MNHITGELIAVEALSQSRLLNLPNLHILMHRRDDGVMVGHCLDFDIHAYSEQQENQQAIENVYSRICEMVVFQIIALLQNDSLDKMYENRVTDPALWEMFNNLHAKNKIESLKKSIEEVKNKDLDELKEVINRDKTNSEQLSDIESSDYKFSNLSETTFSKLKHILEQIQSASPDEAQYLVNTLLSVLPSEYRLEMVS
ncbi:MAG: hypothetical protein GY754_08060 [bacterium]|nr:hypothetical protein [bacterium]